MQTTVTLSASKIYRWYVVFILLLAYCLSFIDRQIITLLVAPIRSDLNITDFEFSLLNMAFAIFFAIFGLPIGRLADRKNRRNIIVIGVIVWSFMTAMCGAAKTFIQLFAARVGVGVGESSLAPSAYSILSDYFPSHELSKPMAVFSMGSTMGTGLALLVGGAIVSSFANFGPIDVPFFGMLKAWQLSFIIVALPGILIAFLVMTLREPPRTGITDIGVAEDKAIPYPVLFKYINERKRVYLPHFLGTALMGAVSSGTLLWYPTFMNRTYDLNIGDAGIQYGAVFLIFGLLGVIVGGWLSAALAKRGYRDANLRVLVVATAASLVPYVAGPLMPTSNLALVLAACAIFLTQMMAGVTVAAIQIITPNQLRAQLSALFLLILNFVGMGMGAPIIAGFTDFFFVDDNMLRYSMVMVSVILIPIASLLMLYAQRHYKQYVID